MARSYNLMLRGAIAAKPGDGRIALGRRRLGWEWCDRAIALDPNVAAAAGHGALQANWIGADRSHRFICEVAGWIRTSVRHGRASVGSSSTPTSSRHRGGADPNAEESRPQASRQSIRTASSVPGRPAWPAPAGCGQLPDRFARASCTTGAFCGFEGRRCVGAERGVVDLTPDRRVGADQPARTSRTGCTARCRRPEPPAQCCAFPTGRWRRGRSYPPASR